MKARNRGKGAPQIAIPGVDTMKEAKAPSHGFKKGGAIPALKEGGTVPGFKAGGRLDKAPRSANMRGRSPLSSAAKTTGPD
jgi:hypothetical protein